MEMDMRELTFADLCHGAVEEQFRDAISEIVAEGDVPSEASLRPYRTFIELDQPESVFILRAKKGASGIEFALFEADGGKWRIEAIQSIHAFLQQSLPDLQIIA